jgi:hypothetical protein
VDVQTVNSELSAKGGWRRLTDRQAMARRKELLVDPKAIAEGVGLFAGELNLAMTAVLGEVAPEIVPGGQATVPAGRSSRHRPEGNGVANPDLASIRLILSDRFPNHLIPYGQLAAVAREFNVSNSRVRAQALRGGYIVLTHPLGKPRATEVIRGMLRERFPDKVIPRGQLQAIATECGVSRQRVHQVAVASAQKLSE